MVKTGREECRAHMQGGSKDGYKQREGRRVLTEGGREGGKERGREGERDGKTEQVHTVVGGLCWANKSNHSTAEVTTGMRHPWRGEEATCIVLGAR